MEWRRRRRRRGLMPTSVMFYCVAFWFFVACTVSMSAESFQACSEIRSRRTKLRTYPEDEYRRRRNLVRPGSRPPRCATKCGSCTPCRPVRVAVSPGSPVSAEYYPEAWRCKCGNHLYMP